jgi:hypothetical protein
MIFLQIVHVLSTPKKLHIAYYYESLYFILKKQSVSDPKFRNMKRLFFFVNISYRLMGENANRL